MPSIYRVDKFAVPHVALPAFMERVRHAQQTLDAQPGRVRNLVLEQEGGPGEFNVVTITEWESAEAMAAARDAMAEQFRREGFDPDTFRRSLGIRADVGTYRPVARA
jgi:heme-degrading monooxygenase HmoA